MGTRRDTQTHIRTRDIGGANVKVCVAANITMPDAYIKTKKVSEWKKEGLTIGKRPCVFLILA